MHISQQVNPAILKAKHRVKLITLYFIGIYIRAIYVSMRGKIE